MTKDLMIGPMGNSEFSFPSVSKVSGKQNYKWVIKQDGRVVFDAPLILNFLAIM